MTAKKLKRGLASEDDVIDAASCVIGCVCWGGGALSLGAIDAIIAFLHPVS